MRPVRFFVLIFLCPLLSLNMRQQVAEHTVPTCYHFISSCLYSSFKKYQRGEVTHWYLDIFFDFARFVVHG